MGPVLETFEGPLSRKRRFIRNLAMIGSCVLIVGILAWKLCFVAKPTVMPALPKQWHDQIYSLDDDETIRFVPPPYTPQRMKNISSWEKQLGYAFYSKDRVYVIDRESWAPWEHPRRLWLNSELWPRPKSFGDLKAALEFAAEGLWPDARVAEELKDVPVDGDWIVRGDSPVHQRMTTLVAVLKFVTAKDLKIEYQPLEHDVEDWSLRLDNHGPLKLIKDRQSEPGLILVERKQPR